MKNNIKKILLALILSSMMLITGMNDFTLHASGDTSIDNGDVIIDKIAKAVPDTCRTFEVELKVERKELEQSVPIDVVLVIDTSTSMTTGWPTSRMAATKAAAVNFAQMVLGGSNTIGNKISVVNYGTNANHTLDWTNSLSSVIASIDGLNPGSRSYTNIHEGFIFAEQRIDEATIARPNSTKVIVMMSDGGANRYMDGTTTIEDSVTYPTSHTAATIAAYLKGQALQSKADIFTIGLFTGMSGGELTTAQETLEFAAPTNQFLNAPDTDALDGIYDLIAKTISNPPLQSGVVTDVVGNDFDLVESSLPSGATYDSINRTITWSLGNIPQGEEKTLKYHVTLKGNHRGGTNLKTNEWAKLDYRISSSAIKTEYFPIPLVDVALAGDINLIVNKQILLSDGTVKPAGSDDAKVFTLNVVGMDEGSEVYNENIQVSRNNSQSLLNLPAGSYTITESDGEGYEYISMLPLIMEYGCGLNNFGITINNKELPTTSLTATKSWVDGPDLHPTIQLQLYRNNVALGDSVDLGNEETTYTWSDLVTRDRDGNTFTYTFKEVNVPENYVMTQNGNTVTNTYVIPKTSLTANKIWENGPQDDRPDVKLQLLRNGAEEGSVVTLEHGEIEYTWTDLDKTDISGNVYTYSFKEVEVPENYTMTQSGNTVTNKYVIPKIDVVGSKLWINGPEDRPTIQLQLYQDEVKYGDPVDLISGVTEYKWFGLDETDINGVFYDYTVEEVDVPENYTFTRDGNLLINTYVIPKIDVTGSKLWINGPEVHPMIQLQLYQDNEPYGDPVDLVDGVLEHTWKDLDKTTLAGVEHVYRVDEVSVPEHYEMTRDGNLLINTYVSPKTEVTGYKEWIGGPDSIPSIQLMLYQNGYPMEEKTVTLSDGKFSHTWTDLDLNDKDGNKYSYTVDEVAVPLNYIKDISEDGLKVTNTYVSPKMDIAGNKIWINGPLVKSMIELQLFRDDIAFGDSVELASGTFEYIWKDLDVTDADGKAYAYSIKELDAPAGYVATYSEDGLTVTNTYIVDTGDVTAYKVWELGPTTHPTIEFQLLRDGVVFGDAVELKDGTVKYTWSNLDLTDNRGKAYVYTVREVEVPVDYDMSISEDGLTITNTHSAVLAAVIPEVPKTGINNNEMLFTILLIISGAGLFVLPRKKKKEVK